MIHRRDVCAFALGFVACFVLHLINFEGRSIAVLGSPPSEVCDDGHITGWDIVRWALLCVDAVFLVTPFSVLYQIKQHMKAIDLKAKADIMRTDLAICLWAAREGRKGRLVRVFQLIETQMLRKMQRLRSLPVDVCLNIVRMAGLPNEARQMLHKRVEACWPVAVRHGRVEVMAWLRKRDPTGCPWNEDTTTPVTIAAAYDQLAAVQWLRAPERAGGPCPYGSALQAAAVRGHAGIVEWMLAAAEPPSWDVGTCGIFAYTGNIEALKVARKFDPPAKWDEMTCGAAAIRGKTDVLKWLRSADPPCPYDERTCAIAAENKQWGLLKWARTEADPPFPWTSATKAVAARYLGEAEVESWPGEVFVEEEPANSLDITHLTCVSIRIAVAILNSDGGPTGPETLIGAAADAKAASGKWWPAIVTKVSSVNGVVKGFDVTVEDGRYTKWTNIPPKNVRVHPKKE